MKQEMDEGLPHTMVDIVDDCSVESIESEQEERDWCREIMCMCCCSHLFAPVLMPIKRYKRRGFPSAMFLFMIVITIWTFLALEKAGPAVEKLENDFQGLDTVALKAATPEIVGRYQEIIHPWGAASIRGLKQGKVWTLLSCAFLHNGFAHWMMNMLGMTVAGWKLNCLIGHLHFCLIFIITAVGSALMQLTVSNPETIMRGTSGVVFGLYGALFGVVVIYWSKFKSVRVSMAVMLSIMMIMEIFPLVMDWWRVQKGGAAEKGGTQVGHVAHLAGFAGGIMYVLAVQPCSWNEELAKVYAKKIGEMGQKIGMVLFIIFVLVPAVVCVVRAVQL